MSKMQTLAKVLVTITVIYLLVKAIGWLISTFTNIFNFAFNDKDIYSIVTITASLIFQLLIILFLIMILYRRNKIAERIVGKEEPLNPQSQLNWIPFAYRLTSVIAGLYCFSSSIFYFNNLTIIFLFGMHSDSSQYVLNSEILKTSISLLILLAGGIYLCCGAPHFVRWQTKKTIEMCVLKEEDKKQ